MSQKLHCDICDSTNSVRSSGSEFLSIVVNGLKHTLKLKLDFHKEYHHDLADDGRKDLCHECQTQVFARLFEKFAGGKHPREVDDRRTR